MSSNEMKTPAENWPEAHQFKKSFRWEFSLYVSGVIMLLMLVTGWVITDQYVDTVTDSVVEKLLVQARSYSGPAGKHVLSTDGPDALMLNNICKRLSEDNPDLYWAGISDQNDVFMAHTEMKHVISGGTLSGSNNESYGNISRTGETVAISSDTIRISIPIEERDIALGHLTVASSVREIAAARQKSIVTVASISLIMILLGIPVTMLITHRKLRPMSIITGHLKEVDLDDIALDIPLETRNEFGYLAETLRVMGSRLKAAQGERIERERIERELEIAREIQDSILPDDYPMSPKFEFYGTYQSAREVGGDYYDFIDFDDDHIACLVADVSGKSLPGMLVMLLTRDIVRKLSRTVRQPDELLSEVNRELKLNIKKGMFVTMFYGLLNKKTGEFSFASAGHNPMILINGRSGDSKLINPKGYPLGMMPPAVFDKRIEKMQVNLESEDWLIQYTDGINEAQNTDEEEYGMDRFVEALKQNLPLGPKDMIDNTISRHRQFVGEAPQYDDITLMAMKWYGQSVDNKNIERMETADVH